MTPSWRSVIVVALALVVSASSARAGFSHVEVRDVSAEVGTPAGLVTWRVVAIFTETSDQLLAVSGRPEVPLVFETNDPLGLVNDGGPFAGFKQEDFAGAPLTAAYDSYLTIEHLGFAGNDTNYSPNFLDNDGINAVIVDGMTTFVEPDGAWFDSEPGTPQFGPEVPIAQFTVRAGHGVSLAGWLDWQPAPGQLGETPFCAATPAFAPCPADVDGNGVVERADVDVVLASWGECAAWCPADLDASGVVDFGDLLLALSAPVGDCPGTGACCLPDGSCRQLGACLGSVECNAAGGVWQGDGSSCSTIECLSTACCFPDGTCAEVLVEDCAELGGNAQPAGLSCATAGCLAPPCFPDAPVDHDVGDYPSDVVAADLDGDGDQDLATVDGFSDTLTILWNEGGEVFTRESVTFPDFSFLHALTAGDLDGDGDADLVVTKHVRHVQRLWNDGTGQFTPAPLLLTNGDGVERVVAVDIDLDDDLDLVVNNRDSGEVSVFVNLGRGAYGPSTEYPFDTSTGDVAVGNLDGDGFPDLVVAEYQDNEVVILRNGGDGTFANPTSYAANNRPTAIALDDWSGDGHLDIVTANQSNGTVQCQLNDGAGGFTQQAFRITTGSWTTSVTTGDVDGDGDVDVMAGRISGGTEVVLILNDDGAPFIVRLPTSGTTHALLTAELNGAPPLDLAAVLSNEDRVALFFGRCGAGACCLADGSCVDVEPEACSAQGGTFAGHATTCREVRCP